MIDPKGKGFDGRTMQQYPETWAIVCSPDAIILMREMAENRRPAVEALHYVPTFVRLDEIVRRESTGKQYGTFHQTVGRMCGSVMEALGYAKDEVDVQMTSKYSLFQVGTVYHWQGFET